MDGRGVTANLSEIRRLEQSTRSSEEGRVSLRLRCSLALSMENKKILQDGRCKRREDSDGDVVHELLRGRGACPQGKVLTVGTRTFRFSEVFVTGMR